MDEPNPFNVEQRPIAFDPAIAVDQLDKLDAAIKSGLVTPEQADAAVAAIKKAIEEKKSASEIFSIVTSVLKGVVGLLK
jgi:predicted RNA-binding protein associated with RNAse of E/G family